jgi:hypothetical protein
MEHPKANWRWDAGVRDLPEAEEEGVRAYTGQNGLKVINY